MSNPEFLTFNALRAIDAELDARAGPGHPASGLKAGVLSPSGVVVTGADGYLFVADGSNGWERQYSGQWEPPAEWYGAWRRTLLQRQAEAARRGIAVVNLVVPEKQVIYPDKRWKAPVDASRRPLLRLMPELPQGLRIVYPQQHLRAARVLGPAFHRHNSHWTPSGCCAAIHALTDELGLQLDWETLRFAYRRETAPQDLTVHLFEPPPPEDCGALAAAGEVYFELSLAETERRNTGSRYGIRNPDAPDPRRVVIFGDSYSYGSGLARGLSAIFAQVCVFWFKNLDWGLVEEHGADIVVWESAERFIPGVASA